MKAFNLSISSAGTCVVLIWIYSWFRLTSISLLAFSHNFSVGPDFERHLWSDRPDPSGSLAAECFAGNIRMPVHKRAVGILLPRPHMQRVKGRKPEAIGSIEQVKELSHKLRRPLILCIPHGLKNQIVSTDQAQSSARHGLVDHDLGTLDVNDTAAHQGAVHKVQAHGSLS